MSRFKEIYDQYCDWLVDIVSNGRFAKGISYTKLLSQLQSIPFRYGKMKKDKNRVEDGIYLRYRFARDDQDCCKFPVLRQGECSVLEMMIALAVRCEETIMDDPRYGDRTGQWFWQMISSMGLSCMTDDVYDEESVNRVVDRMMSRNYEPNGKGGLFTIRGFEGDLREEDIWTQLCWYLDSIA